MSTTLDKPKPKANRQMPAFKKVAVTPAHDRAIKEARLGYMAVCPFLSSMYISETEEVWTDDVPTAATDGRRIALNPAYLAKLKPAQRIFVLAHETDHILCRHPQRFAYYDATKGPDGEKFDWELANKAADYTINARLVAGNIGKIHPDWLFRADITGDMLWEDVYKMLKRERRRGSSGGTKDQPGRGEKPGDGQGDGDSPSGSGPGGGDIMAPRKDPASGREDVMSDMDHREAVARAVAAAKGQGKMPAGYQQLVDEILDHQVPWQEHVRLTMTGRIGTARETWTTLNRRRVALDPMICLPGRRGYGCNTIVVGLDTSGSIYCDQKLLAVFFAEVGGIIADINPKHLIVVQCDAAVQQVDDVKSLDDVSLLRSRGAKGGGGTSFVPVFDWITSEGLAPDMLVYLTDGYGTFPSQPPRYPVLWAMNTDVTAPFGDTVRVKIEGA
ncbi:MAG: hypothetical protein EBU31_02050 [Proteobacteria bacterium]|nr:hypothetical protein [Pseudomonadota bacterium]